MTESAESSRTPAGAVRVLVVDDNRDAADSLCLMLAMWGYQVQAAYDGLAAMPAARQYQPDCMILDIGLPGVDGYALARQLRQDVQFRHMPLVALTAYPEREQVMAAGFDYFLQKPADPSELRAILRNLHALGRRLERGERLAEQQLEVVAEARDTMKEVKADLQEVKQELREVKEGVKEVKEELREAKERHERQ